jgi:UDP-glucose 4-epimerase
MRLILTGSNGNLGREIISQNSIHEILPIRRDNWSYLSGLSFGKDDIFVHAASDLTSLIHEDPFSVMDSNLVSTARLLEFSKGCALFIFISSCAVYGDALKTTENTRCRPLSINGITKLLNERIVEEFCSKNAIPYLILRVFNMYGGQDRFSIIHKLQQSIKMGIPFKLNNNGIAQRDFVHVSDVAGVVLKLSMLDLPSGYLNVGTGCAIKISEIITMVKELYPNLKIVEDAEAEVEYSRADISKLNGILDCDFMSIEEQLLNIIKSIL